MFAATASLALTISSAASVAAASAKPNFLFLLSESLDGRLLREDSPAKIPNIRALLASGSIRFDAGYSNNPVCAPSRSSLWSGRAPLLFPIVGALAEDTLMFCGTLAARGGIRPAPRFSFEIEDPVRGAKIAQTYAIATLPVAG